MNKIKVLIVDDSQAARNGLSSILRVNPDIEVLGEAVDGAEAIAKAKQLQPTLILMDSQMSGMDGCEATRRIKKLFPSIKILYLTVHASFIDDAIGAGADGYLLKDSGRQELLHAIRDIAGDKA